MADARPRPPGKPRGSASSSSNSSVKSKRRSTRASVTPTAPRSPAAPPPTPRPAALPEEVLDTSPPEVTEESHSEEEVNNGSAVVEEEFQDLHISQREMFRKRVALLGVTEDSWTEENLQRLDQYATDTSIMLMVVYLDPSSAGLQVEFAMPSQVVDQVSYFIRRAEAEFVEETFEACVQFGMVRGEPTEGLLRLMSAMFVPNMAREASQWPESVRNHSIVDLHQYLSKLTDARFKMEGKTVLYIPMEALQHSPEEASKDKALVGRLEIVVIHWTRQIKEMLKAQEAVEMGDIAGPLEELVFWRGRLEDLLGIGRQLQTPQVARIQRTLELVRSHYVQPFCAQAEAIQASSRQAGFNLHWLSLLKEPCEKLAGLHPSQMAPTLRYIISLVRVIWVNSPCYNTKERIGALLLKMGNEIIRLCCQSISLDRIFQGYVSSSRQTLHHCIHCCLCWREAYQHAAQTHRRHSPKDWVLDESSLFPLIDIFVQRCKDLLEVCDCQQQFARREEGPQMAPLPCFGGGHQKEELTRSLLAIEGTFERSLQALRSVGKGILDIRNSSWFQHYKRFCHAVKDLEVRLQNLLRSALETVDSVEEGVMLIDIFRPLCARPAMRGTLDRMTVTVWDIFHKELDLVNKELSQRSGATAAHMPHHAGQAHWARGLRQRIERPMEVIREAHFLPQTAREDEVRLAHGQLAQVLDELVRRSYHQWKEGLDDQSQGRLERPLIVRCRDNRAMLDVNFDKNLLKMFCEIHYWERLQFEIPHYVSAIYQRSQDLQGLRGSVLLLVSHYNRIMEALSPAELDLFRERIAFLDKKFQPGLTKLLWNTKGVADFISDCRLHTSKVQSIVDRYKAANLAISSHCRQISETLLVRVDGKTAYRVLEFEEEQKVHRQRQLQRLRSAHQDIVKLMTQVHSPFRTDGAEVQQQWVGHTERVDRLVEEALRLNVKRSLQELSRAVTGDKKTAPKPTFRLEVVLRPKADGTSAKVQFSPTLQTLAQLVNGVGVQLIGAVSVFRRLPDLLTHTPSQRRPIHAVIEEDEEIVKIQATVSGATASIAVHLQAYLQTWDRYREIWEVNKDGFVRRYQKLNQPVSSFDADIARYTEVANNVQKEEAVVSVQFVLLDCTPLKMSLVQHCDEWQGKFTQLLSLTACTRLGELHTFLHHNSSRLHAPTQTQAELVESLQLLESLQGDVSRLEARIAPIHEQFAILDKYEVPVELPVQQMLETLNGEWSWFRKTLLDSGTVLRQRKEEVKRELLTSTKEFTMKTQRALHDFNSSGPFGSAVRSIFAKMEMEALRGQLDGLREEEGRLRHGLAMFSIEPPAPRELQALEKDLGHLQEVWELVQLWNNKWDKWKKVPFSALHTDSMEAEANSMLTQLHTLSAQLKDKQWEIVDFSRNKIEQFKMTVPVITDLRNPAMRDRHWQRVGQELQRPFEQSLTLESLMALGLDQHTDTIQHISTSASKELTIEQDLEGISTTWEEVCLDVTPYRDQGHHMLRGTEEVLQILEDHQVVLSSMKASRFVRPFVGEVDRWERCLSHVQEVIERILTTQRLWMYLENIFLGGDMRQQMCEECDQFDVVSSTWKSIMEGLRRDQNALRGTQHQGLPENLGRTIRNLEEIQRSLEVYLDTRRQLFPRFYFLSDDDLVQILGQSRNPAAVQPHLAHCFTGIHSLRVCKVGSSGVQSEASGMLSVDKEFMEFSHPVLLDGPVESWLCDVEKAMRVSLNDCLRSCRLALRKMADNREKWVRDWPGQMLITASQIQWTADITKALILGKERGNRSELKAMMKKQMSMLGLYSEALRGNLSQSQRVKMVALVTVEVHGRDVIDSLGRAGCKDLNSFHWLSQLRFYWEKEVDDCVIRQTSACFKYGYEYLGNSGRLVITPLTDRCFMALTTALHLHRGGSLKGPAGTGKTETVKDLGKALGMHVIVVNCSEGLDYKCMARMYSGLAQMGAWGCFDEFNRVSVGVQSVLAQRIRAIQVALATGQDRFVYDQRPIRLVPSCGIFITMNPGHNGHRELPDNLACMFRPFSMVVPDSAVIAHITLFGEGFGKCEELSQKVISLYRLVVDLLSKQNHYDFGLRALHSLLHYAGTKRRSSPNMTDEEILVMSLKDMNLAKLTSDDLLLFNGILQDLFPAVETPPTDHSKLREAVEEELRRSGLQATASAVTKVLQLYQAKRSHHACMLVGKTGSGKTVTWRALQGALTALHRKGEADFQPVREYPLNPKALSVGELYGETDPSTNKWRDGVLSSIMRTACTDEKADEKWLVLDGPVDALWIESMNALMDDNKVLTLINGERISMPPQVSLLFEVEDLAMASPATVSRCGVVYNDCSVLGWKPYLQSWLDKRAQAEVDHLGRLFDRYTESTLSFKKSCCVEPVPVTELSAVSSLCRLYHALATPENGVNPTETEHYGRMVELWFIFSLVWSLCSSVDQRGRERMDNFLREMEGSFPNKHTIYDYYVDTKNKTWAPFQDKLPKGWRYAANAPFYKMVVPTLDTVRYSFLVSSLVLARCPVLLTGPVGAGKTTVAQGVLQGLDTSLWTVHTVNMSSQTTSNDLQSMVERRVEKRTKGQYVPLGGKRMLCFLDDLSMASRDPSGAQPPLELLRLWMDHGFWYDRRKQTTKAIKDMVLLASMAPPGGGRSHISGRLQARFNLINMTFPNDAQILHIFGSMMQQRLEVFEEELKPLGQVVTRATLELFHAVTQRFLPTPNHTHYLFNLRDISKVFQGLLRMHRDFHDTKHTITRLWTHECFRVFSDRLVDHSDMDAFVGLLAEKLGSHFDLAYHTVCPNKTPPLFGDFRKEVGVYEDLTDMGALRSSMEAQLEEYNLQPAVVPMSLVLFRDAIQHIARVVRVISQPRGHMLLVGTGGSGKQSTAKMAAFLCQYHVFQVQVNRHYGKQDFREDIKRLYRLTGVDNKPTVFLLNDSHLSDESFLEDINNILSSGEVPNLYTQAEFDEVCNALSESARKDKVMETPDSLFSYLMERVRNNLHVVLCMSPVGHLFRTRVRQYPALVHCTTMDWFCDWPGDALLEVAHRHLHQHHQALGATEGILTKVLGVCVTVHQSVGHSTHRMSLELRRPNYVTPAHYLELVSGYSRLLSEKHSELGEQADKLRTGLLKIDDTRSKVEAMSLQLTAAKKNMADFQRQCDEYLDVIVTQKKEADEQQKVVSAHSEKIAAEEVKCKTMADNAQRDLEVALPALEEAMKALESLNKKDLTEIKSYGRPPTPVETVMMAVMTLLGKEPTWTEAKRQLGEGNFINTLVHFDKDNISDLVLRKIAQYCYQSDFQPDIIGKVSLASKSLCMWVRAMEIYGRVYRVVEPKRALLRGATAQLAEKQTSLAQAQHKLTQVGEKLEQLKAQYSEKSSMKEKLKAESTDMELKLDRAAQLVSGLADEGVRWEEAAAALEQNMGYLVGDCLLAASFLSYLGPFPSSYREQLMDHWMKEVRELEVPCSPQFSLASFLSDPAAVRQWNTQGLLSDAFSTENAIIVTHCNRWPLMVDPQGQALKWIRNMEAERGLTVIDLQTSDYLGVLEKAMRLGTPVLLHNVQEDLDPCLTPILRKSLTRIGGRQMLRLGDREVEYDSRFRLYITTKLLNPHYSPHVSANTTTVNFAVKEQGLEEQLLGVVLRMECPDLEEQKDALVVSMAAGRKNLQDMEDDILRLLNSASGSLLEEVTLVDTLHSCKLTAREVAKQLESSLHTEAKIDTAREAYRPCARRAAILFLVLMDLGVVSPMYQYSLDAYTQLFALSVRQCPRHHKLDDRLVSLNHHHTFSVYTRACWGLLKDHTLLFSFHMCVKILEAAGRINADEYAFFLRGGLVLDKAGQMDNPFPGWLPDGCWDDVTELDKLANFHGVMASFEMHPDAWRQWYSSAEPETTRLPGEWEERCDELQRMLVVRSLRPDRVSSCVASFIANNLDASYRQPPALHMQAVLEASSNRCPLVFVLSRGGADPTATLAELAEACGASQRLLVLPMGQGQAPCARAMVLEGMEKGHWVFLANCHLCLSWMAELEQLVERLQDQEVHPDFRLWLSSAPHPRFPISILQAAIKITNEPPQGVKANVSRVYELATTPEPRRCSVGSGAPYRKLLFALCFFHSVLLERRTFLQLGWNQRYHFSDADFEASESLLRLCLDESEEGVPWDTLRALVAGVTYGGHVTDEWDRRLLAAYSNDCFCEAAVMQPYYKLTSLPAYFLPGDGTPADYRDYIGTLPPTEHPEVFGLHPNAAVANQVAASHALFHTLLSLQPQDSRGAAASGASREDKVLELCAELRAQLPALMDYAHTRTMLQDDTSPLNTLLLQEIQAYNALLTTVKSSLLEVEQGIRGLVVMSPNLEEIFNCIYDGRVPMLWAKAYASVKPLAWWVRDLCQRVEQFARWAESARPPVLYWLSGFTSPRGFLTAVLQASARHHHVPVETLSWDFSVFTVDESNLLFPPKDGVYMRGLYLEGAGWDQRNSCLVEAEAMQLVCPVPAIHFKPSVTRKRTTKGMYSCPCYSYPVRSGGPGGPSFVVSVDLQAGSATPEHWVKRGTALLLGL